MKNKTKNSLKLLGFIAIIAVIGLGMAGCDPLVEDCPDTEHVWGSWDTSETPSVRICTVCEKEEKCYCDNIGNWTRIGTTNEAEGKCSTCQRTEKLAKKHFIGKWVNSTNNQTIEISSDGAFRISNTAGAFWTTTGITWASDTTTAKTGFVVGFSISGTAGGSASNPWVDNTAGTAGVYINSAGDKIIVRLTTAFLGMTDAANTPREYTFTKD